MSLYYVSVRWDGDAMVWRHVLGIVDSPSIEDVMSTLGLAPVRSWEWVIWTSLIGQSLKKNVDSIEIRAVDKGILGEDFEGRIWHPTPDRDVSTLMRLHDSAELLEQLREYNWLCT